MTLGEFLDVIGGEYVRVSEENIFKVIYEADKNAIRMNMPELLDRKVYRINPVSKVRFEVLVY